MTRRRIAVAVLAGLCLAIVAILACGPPPEGWQGAGRQYLLPTPIPAGQDGSAESGGGMDTSMPPPPDTAPPPPG
jgi:hypothetical protein